MKLRPGEAQFLLNVLDDLKVRTSDWALQASHLAFPDAVNMLGHELRILLDLRNAVAATATAETQAKAQASSSFPRLATEQKTQ